MCELLVHESLSGGLIGHLGVHKTLDVLFEHFYWPHIEKILNKYVHNALYVGKLSLSLCRMVYTHLYLFLLNLRLIFL